MRGRAPTNYRVSLRLRRARLGERLKAGAREDRQAGIFRKTGISYRTLAKVENRAAVGLDAPGVGALGAETGDGIRGLPGFGFHGRRSRREKPATEKPPSRLPAVAAICHRRRTATQDFGCRDRPAKNRVINRRSSDSAMGTSPPQRSRQMAGGKAALFQVLLVIFFRAPEFGPGNDFGDNGPSKRAGFLELFLRCTSCRFLRRRMEKDH